MSFVNYKLDGGEDIGKRPQAKGISTALNPSDLDQIDDPVFVIVEEGRSRSNLTIDAEKLNKGEGPEVEISRLFSTLRLYSVQTGGLR